MSDRDRMIGWLGGMAAFYEGTDSPSGQIAPLVLDRLKALEEISDAAWQLVVLDEYNDAPADEAWERLKAAVKDYQPRNVDPLLVGLHQRTA